VGLEHPGQHGPDAELLQEAAHNLGAGPLPESADALNPAAGAGRAMIRKAATACPSTICP